MKQDKEVEGRGAQRLVNATPCSSGHRQARNKRSSGSLSDRPSRSAPAHLSIPRKSTDSVSF